MKLANSQPSHGFTLIELVLAMSIFAFFMLILTVGILQVFKMYQADLSSKQTQEAARSALDQISRDIRNSPTAGVHSGGGWICLNNDKLAIWQDSDNLLRSVNPPDCDKGDFEDDNSTVTYIIQGTQCINNPPDGLCDVQARSFKVESVVDDSGNVVSIKLVLTVTTGGADLFKNNQKDCQVGSGYEFCGSTTVTSVVSLRGAL